MHIDNIFHQKKSAIPVCSVYVVCVCVFRNATGGFALLVLCE